MMDNKIMTAEQIEERKLEIAIADECRGLASCKIMRDSIYELVLEQLDNEIANIEGASLLLRDALKADFLAHVEAGGNPNIDKSIVFKRTKKFEYDKKHALQFVIDNDLPYIRVKKELDANPFKKACLDGTINYADGEEQNNPSVAIGALGHMLIPGYTPDESEPS